MKPSTFRRLMNLWPPFLFTGIHVTAISGDWRQLRVELRERPWNRNYVRTHFGGSLFAMTDPMWMLLLMHTLGNDYYVWDKAAEIEFVKPGKGVVKAEFRLDDADLAEIRAATAGGGKYLHWFPVEVTDAQGDVVARVRKQLYVRLKPKARQA
ncbi:DUF4442 domain-containing protein [Pseudoxanthomonas sangjuensis]|uniref:DUF4442 domain-containing protein n=1 Tax=Pseudoxanthomonas sangjuensis TaxID=1503750 RepID=UPI001390A42E|nr:DUF4442 domain-containing protein [Pseudoxanthomonas sangjuensis]KAF1715297.1 tetrameric acyl-CoA thioesterase [Pseudoxanthomonas sangjuensis]